MAARWRCGSARRDRLGEWAPGGAVAEPAHGSPRYPPLGTGMFYRQDPTNELWGSRIAEMANVATSERLLCSEPPVSHCSPPSGALWFLQFSLKTRIVRSQVQSQGSASKPSSESRCLLAPMASLCARDGSARQWM